MESKSQTIQESINLPAEKVLIPELIDLIRCINEYYTLKESMGHSFMNDIKDMADNSESDSMVPKAVDSAIEKAFIKQLQKFS